MLNAKPSMVFRMELLGVSLRPHPFPEIVRDFQSVIGREAKQQYQGGLTGRDLPDALVALCWCGNLMLSVSFHPFVEDEFSYVWS